MKSGPQAAFKSNLHTLRYWRSQNKALWHNAVQIWSHNSQFSSFKCHTFPTERKQEMKQEWHPLKRFHWDFLTKNTHKVHDKQKRYLQVRLHCASCCVPNSHAGTISNRKLICGGSIAKQISKRPEMRAYVFYQKVQHWDSGCVQNGILALCVLHTAQYILYNAYYCFKNSMWNSLDYYD